MPLDVCTDATAATFGHSVDRLHPLVRQYSSELRAMYDVTTHAEIKSLFEQYMKRKTWMFSGQDTHKANCRGKPASQPFFPPLQDWAAATSPPRPRMPASREQLGRFSAWQDAQNRPGQVR